jgi:hypothetical protein
MVVRRVFPGWSICIPRSFREDLNEKDAYWHAWDASRSVSLTSILLVDESGPVEQETLAAVLALQGRGKPESLPPGLAGWAVDGPAIQPAHAGRAMSALLAADGRVLIATITHDDLDWARKVLASIRSHPVALGEDLHEVEAAPVH